MNFTPDQLERFSRQILVRDFGGNGQAKLSGAHIAVIGAGGIGAPLLLYLVGAGLGRITLYEDDDVSLSNLHRQILYQTQDIGTPKAEKAQAALQSLNPDVQITLAGRFDDTANPSANFLIDGSDRLDIRQMVNRAAARLQTPVLAASLAQWEGQIAHYDPANHAGCYECIYPEGTDASLVPSCSEAGVMGPVAGVLGTMAALETIKLIADIEPLPPASIFVFDGLFREGRLMRVKPRLDCPVCGGKSQ